MPWEVSEVNRQPLTGDQAALVAGVMNLCYRVAYDNTPFELRRRLDKIELAYDVALTQAMAAARKHDPATGGDYVGFFMFYAEQKVRNFWQRRAAKASTGAKILHHSLDGDLVTDGQSGARLVDEGQAEPWTTVRDCPAVLAEAIARLTPGQRASLVARYGLTDGHDKTFATVGRLLGISEDAAEQQCRIALRRLREFLAGSGGEAGS